jgi:hypothetical protein
MTIFEACFMLTNRRAAFLCGLTTHPSPLQAQAAVLRGCVNPPRMLSHPASPFKVHLSGIMQIIVTYDFNIK